MKNRKEGFSLIEVLVATSVLLVIIVLVSMVFQQQSGAFQSGVDRVGGQAALRNVAGMLVRDLTLAVDSEYYPNLPKNQFGNSKISFLATSGTFGKDLDGKWEGTPESTSLQLITYEQKGSVVERSVEGITYKFSGGTASWGRKGKKTAEINDGVKYPITFTLRTIDGTTTFPDAVEVNASFQSRLSSSQISGQCAGPNGEWGDKDDIYVGAKKR